MEVKVLSYTKDPEITCTVAMRSTRTKLPAHGLINPSMPMCILRETGGCLKAYEGCRAKALQKGMAWTAGWTQCRHHDRCAERMLMEAKDRKHWGVFEHATFTVSVEGVSRACTHQLVRHRQNSFLQQSQRAVEIDTSAGDWYVKPATIVNGGQSIQCEARFVALMKEISDLYATLIHFGVPDEDARYILPNACKTNIVITANARQWLHIFYMRLSEAAQWEIREMAQKILEVLMEISPVIFEGAGKLEV